MAKVNVMEVDFEVLLKNYPTYNKLPKHIKDYIDGLNKDLPPGAHKNTPCCMQMSEALNACGASHKIPGRSFRRANPELPRGSGNYFLQAVDEVEKYLDGRYGAGEEIRLDPKDDETTLKGRLEGRQGILTLGADHTELWNKTTVVQSSGYPGSNGAVISPSFIWGHHRIMFWQAMGDPLTRVGVVPSWLEGWWEVSDTVTPHYYYFYPSGVVYSAKARPSTLGCPVAGQDNSGTFTIDVFRKIDIRWNGGNDPGESYKPTTTASPPPLTGTIPDRPAPPFNARKIG